MRCFEHFGTTIKFGLVCVEQTGCYTMSEVQGVRGGLGAVVVEVSALGWARWMVRNPFLKVESPEWFRLRCYKRGNTGLTREPGGWAACDEGMGVSRRSAGEVRTDRCKLIETAETMAWDRGERRGKWQ